MRSSVWTRGPRRRDLARHGLPPVAERGRDPLERLRRPVPGAVDLVRHVPAPTASAAATRSSVCIARSPAPSIRFDTSWP